LVSLQIVFNGWFNPPKRDQFQNQAPQIKLLMGRGILIAKFFDLGPPIIISKLAFFNVFGLPLS
jgi:hypothetical protein